MLEWVDNQFDNLPMPNSENGKELKKALLEIKAYENKNFNIPIQL
jgi:hypothetical protein